MSYSDSIKPYEWVVNLQHDLSKELGPDVACLNATTLNKIAKLMAKWTTAFPNKASGEKYIRSMDTLEAMEKFQPTDFERGLVRHIRTNTPRWKTLVCWLHLAFKTQGYDPNKIIIGSQGQDLWEKIAAFQHTRDKKGDVEGDIYRFKDLTNGFHIVSLNDKQAYEHEGARMDNCIKDNLWDKHKDNAGMEVWSIRDSNNVPHATIELERHSGHLTVLQVEGPDNKHLNDAAVQEAVENLFGLKAGHKIPAQYKFTSHSLHYMGFVRELASEIIWQTANLPKELPTIEAPVMGLVGKSNGPHWSDQIKLFSENLPDIFHYKGPVLVLTSKVHNGHLFGHLKVDGDLVLKNLDLTLCNWLEVSGDLRLIKCIGSLPSHLMIGRDLRGMDGVVLEKSQQVKGEILATSRARRYLPKSPNSK